MRGARPRSLARIAGKRWSRACFTPRQSYPTALQSLRTAITCTSGSPDSGHAPGRDTVQVELHLPPFDRFTAQAGFQVHIEQTDGCCCRQLMPGRSCCCFAHRRVLPGISLLHVLQDNALGVEERAVERDGVPYHAIRSRRQEQSADECWPISFKRAGFLRPSFRRRPDYQYGSPRAARAPHPRRHPQFPRPGRHRRRGDFSSTSK